MKVVQFLVVGVLMLLLTSGALADPIAQRGVNNVVEYIDALGDGTANSPYMPTVTDKSFILAVSMGMVPGYSFIDKFGRNPTVTTITDPEDVWGGGGEYVYDEWETAPIVSIASDSAADTQTVVVHGLAVDGRSVSQYIKLTGSTRACLDTALWRVYRIENEDTFDFVGTVFCYIGTGLVPSVGDAVVRAVIDNGNNQTLMAIYTIPVDKVGFLYRGEIGVSYTAGASSSADYADCYFRSRRFGKVFKVKKDITVIATGNCNYEDRRIFSDPFPNLTDVKLTAHEVSATMGVWGSFDILLVDDTLFSDEYLEKIGQYGH